MSDFNLKDLNYDNDFDLIKYINEYVEIKNIENFYKNNIENCFFATVLSIIIKKKRNGFDYLKSKGVFRVFDDINKSLDVISFIERLLILKDLVDIDEQFLKAKENGFNNLKEYIKYLKQSI